MTPQQKAAFEGIVSQMPSSGKDVWGHFYEVAVIAAMTAAYNLALEQAAENAKACQCTKAYCDQIDKQSILDLKIV